VVVEPVVAAPVIPAPVVAAPVVTAPAVVDVVPVPEPAPALPSPISHVEPTPSVTPAQAPALIAFQVILESEGTTLRYVVVGADIAAAAGTTLVGLARRHPGFDVRSIERIADVLA
jgi:hypothetical protein